MNILAFFRSKKQPPKKTLSTMLPKKLQDNGFPIRDKCISPESKINQALDKSSFNGN